MSLEDLARRDAFRLLCDGIDVVVNKLPEIVEMATQEERAAIVAWLRHAAEEGGDPWMSYCAERIERGEHRREEEP